MRTLSDYKTKHPLLSKFITSIDIDERLYLLPYKHFCFEYKVLSDADKPGFLESLNTLMENNKISHIYLANEWKEHDIGEFIENKSVEFMTSFSKKDQIVFVTNVGKKLDAILSGNLPISSKIINLSELKRRYVLDGNIKDVHNNRLYREIELAIQHLREVEPYENHQIANSERTEQLIDYSDNSKAERVVLMKELGLLDFLKQRMEDELEYFSPNKLAEILSSFTGIEQSTLQSYLNPIYSKNVSDKNNPLKTNKKKARKKLSDMGFST